MRTEKVKATSTLRAIVNGVKQFSDIDRLPCPYCNEQMFKVDNGCYPFEEYLGNGWFERTERFFCDNCYTWAHVTQEYAPASRRMVVNRDVEEG